MALSEKYPGRERPRSVLIVEDEGLIAYDLAGRLQKIGYQIAGILASGEDAVEKVTELKPSLILMDVSLKGEMDGIEAASRILSKYDVPIVYLTAHTDRDTVDRATRTGPFGFLTKPFQQHSLSTSIDIAIYKHGIERELREQRASLSTILSTMDEGVAVLDGKGSIQFLNRVAENMTGWSNSDAQGLPLSSIFAGSDSALTSQLDELIAETLAESRPARLTRGLCVAPRGGGPSTLIEGEIAPSMDRGNAAGAVLTFRDATVREAEEQQRRHEHKIRAVGTLAAGVAHDFNNLLQVVLGYTHDLKNRYHDDFAQEALGQIAGAADSAAAITKQLLQFSRKQHTQPRDLDLNEVIREAEQLLRRVAGNQTLFELRLSPKVLPVRADPDQLRQVLVNLVSNARDAMRGGGVLTIETGTSIEDGPLGAARPAVMLTVRDTGVGMNEEVTSRLFEPFFTTKDLGKGTGLGLSIVHSIVTDLGGVIRVDARPGEGATFRIILPQSQTISQETVLSDARKPAERESRDVTVLLVEDDDSVRRLISAYLVPTGYKILTAPDGRTALEIAESYPNHIDALITDLMMPGMDGVELTAEFKKRGLTPRILFISGFPDEIVRKIGGLPLDSRFLPKPFFRQDLIRELAAVLKEESSVFAA